MQIQTPRWALPLLSPARYKGAKGGRASGKSWFFADYIVESIIRDPDMQIVCIREIQRSLKFSAKKLIEQTIRKYGMQDLFDILNTEIRRVDGNGIIIFEGMQDHTADSIKSLESFNIAWVEEAQSLSHRSVELLTPTIRQDDSELLFSWNPSQPSDAVEQLFKSKSDSALVHVNYLDNPWCPQVMIDEAAELAAINPEKYNHIWLGGYNEKSEAQIFNGCYVIDEFESSDDWNGPYFGLDFGFSADPTAAVKCWTHDNILYIEHDFAQVKLELDKTAEKLIQTVPDIERHVVRADNARPESISYLKRNGLPNIIACQKGKGSVEDGIEFIKSFKKVVIHPRCKATANEFQLYSYKIDKQSGDVLPVIIDAYNHNIDALRYALEPIMRKKTRPRIA